MKKFRFPLKPVATLRGLTEIRMREAFGVARAAHDTAREALHHERGAVAVLEGLLRSERSRSFRPADQAAFLDGYRQALALEAKAVAEVERTRVEMESRRQQWMESRRDVRVVEKLEQKARLHHRLEGERELQAALDDRTSALAGRREDNRP